MSDDITQRIVDYLKQIYPKSATKKEIFAAVGIASCCGGMSLDTLVVRRKIEVAGKKGSSNLYCYKDNSIKKFKLMSGLYPLREISIEITGQCLQNCVHCSSGASVDSQEVLSRDEILGIASEFKQLGGKKIEISGGEPFLHKDIGNILPELKKMGLKGQHFFLWGYKGWIGDRMGQ